MAHSPNYTATQGNRLPWQADGDTRVTDADTASQAVADALQAAARASTLISAISTLPATVTLDISNVETSQLVTTTTPLGQLPELTYVSSDPTKATVSSTGLITPLVAGSTTVTVTDVASGQTDTCVVTVQN